MTRSAAESAAKRAAQEVYRAWMDGAVLRRQSQEQSHQAFLQSRSPWDIMARYLLKLGVK